MNNPSNVAELWGYYYQLECLFEIIGYIIGFVLVFIKLCIR